MSRNKLNILALVVVAAGMMWGCSLGTLPSAQAGPDDSARALAAVVNRNLAGTWTFDNDSHSWPRAEMYHKTMTLAQGADGTCTGNGASLPAQHLFSITGTVSGNAVSLALAYSTISNYVATLTGTIGDDGKMGGTWTDNTGDYGVWLSTSGPDFVPPVVTAPPALSGVEATGTYTSVVLGAASATDNVAVVSLTNDAPAAGFPVGTTTVTWTAKDAAGNSGTATQNVTVVDNGIALEIDDMKIDFKKKADDDKLMIRAHINPLELVDLQKTDAFNLVITSGGTISAGPVTLAIKGHRKGDKWEYARPRGQASDIQRISFDWNEKKVENLTIRLDKAELGGLTNPNAVTVTIQIGRYVATQTIKMAVDKKGNIWKYDPDDKPRKGK